MFGIFVKFLTFYYIYDIIEPAIITIDVVLIFTVISQACSSFPSYAPSESEHND